MSRVAKPVGLKPHDRVLIGGRTMLRPGYSLVGKSGTVFAIGGFVPAGHAQIIVDGETVEDADGTRVLLANVPTPHLELLSANIGLHAVEASSSAPRPQKKKSTFQSASRRPSRSSGASDEDESELETTEGGEATAKGRSNAENDTETGPDDRPPVGLRLV